MLTRAFPFLDPHRITSRLSKSLQLLADDCALLEHDAAFVSARLSTAPLLDRYCPTIGPLGVRLIGDVTGHPLLGTRTIVTSQLWFADPQGQWIRTLSRFYRLGRPAEDDDEKFSPPAKDGSEDNGRQGVKH